MKIQQKYTELTHEAALKLLQENDWRVDNCVFSGEGPYHHGPRSSSFGKLIGLKHGRFVQANGIGGKVWETCSKIEEETVFEAGDRVRACNQVTGLHGLCGTVTAIYPDGYLVHFGAHTLLLRKDELAPEPDPFEEWCRLPFHRTQNLRDAFNAGRDHERKLHDQYRSH